MSHFELWNFNFNFLIFNYKFQTFTFTVPCMFTICKCALCKHFGCKAALLLGEHWPRGSTGRRPVRKKRPTKWVFFFWFPLRKCGDASSRSGLTDFSPFVISIAKNSFHSIMIISMQFYDSRRLHRQGKGWPYATSYDTHVSKRIKV